MITATAICLALTLARAPQKVDPRYMQHAWYPAWSKADPQAAGGYGMSLNRPKRFSNERPLQQSFYVDLAPVQKGVQVTIANGGANEQWLAAGDSLIFGYLQAQDVKGNWRPIEWHWHYTCGNSYHRVSLAPNYYWRYAMSLPRGIMKTRVRWHYQSGKMEMNSNEIELSLPPTRFVLQPSLRPTYHVQMMRNFPVLMMKPNSQRR